MKIFILSCQYVLLCLFVSEAAASNVVPSVYLSSTNNQTSYTFPATIELNVIASDGDGSVVKIEFFLCSTKLAEVSEPPYTIRVKNLSPGTYTFTAKATDNLGAVSETCFTTEIADTSSCGDVVADFEHINVCQGYNTSFWSTSTGSSYPNQFEWKVNGVIISTNSSMNYTFGSPGSYTVQLRTGYNQLCATQTEVIELIDIAPSITGPASVCAYQQDVVYSIPAVSGASYTWWVSGGDASISNNGSNQVIVDFGQNFSQIQVGVNLLDCYKVSVLNLTKTASCGARITPEVVTTPHPFPEQTKVSMNTEEKIYSIRICDMSGKELYYFSGINTNQKLLGEGIPSGCYIMQVMTESGNYFKTLIKY